VFLSLLRVAGESGKIRKFTVVVVENKLTAPTGFTGADSVGRALANECAVALVMASGVPARLRMLQKMTDAEDRANANGRAGSETDPELSNLGVESMRLSLSQQDLFCLPARIHRVLTSVDAHCAGSSASAIVCAALTCARDVLSQVQSTYFSTGTCVAVVRCKIGSDIVSARYRRYHRPVIRGGKTRASVVRRVSLSWPPYQSHQTS
jgi:hypothetical protein